MITTIQSVNGTIIQMPYIGCYSGCAQDYCYIFGIEVPSLLFNLITLVAIVIAFGVGLLLVMYVLKHCYITPAEPSQVMESFNTGEAR
jgi:hypothetical protein